MEKKLVEMEGIINVDSQSVENVVEENREDVNMPGNVNETRNVEISESLRV